MILVDTSVWIWHFRGKEPDLTRLLDTGQVLVHPLVIGELACGNLPGRREVLQALHKLPTAPRATDDEALNFIERHRLMGQGINYSDVHILSSVVLAADTQLWTFDARLAAAAARLSVWYDPAH